MVDRADHLSHFQDVPDPHRLVEISDAPAITFSSVFCAASATAMPPTPRPARAGVASIAEEPQGREEAGEENQQIAGPAEKTQQGCGRPGVRARKTSSNVLLDLPVQQHEQPGD